MEIAPTGLLHVAPATSATLSHTNSSVFSPSDALVNSGVIHVDHASFETGWRTTNAGTIVVRSGTATLWNLSNNSGTIRVSAGGMLRLSNLPALNTGVIDLADGGAAALGYLQTPATVRALILSGRNQGRWDGPGINSSSAQLDPATAVGYLQITDLAITTWRGVRVDYREMVVAHTLLGDATLDGTVNFADLVKMAQNYNTSNKHWFDGDFNYDGRVDFADLVSLAQNYNGSLVPSDLPGAAAGVDSDFARAFASVPEPGALSLLGIAACAFAPAETAPARIRSRI